jgi:hypothetical protein
VGAGNKESEQTWRGLAEKRRTGARLRAGATFLT